VIDIQNQEKFKNKATASSNRGQEKQNVQRSARRRRIPVFLL